jgi:hypothetical protein
MPSRHSLRRLLEPPAESRFELVGVENLTAAFSGRPLRSSWAGPPSFAASCAVGVGHDPDPITPVGRAKG